MSATGDAFVTPHAVRRFQQRIAPLPYEAALSAIIGGIYNRERKPLRNGVGWYVRSRRPYPFRACLRASAAGSLPVVFTVLKG